MAGKEISVLSLNQKKKDEKIDRIGRHGGILCAVFEPGKKGYKD